MADNRSLHAAHRAKKDEFYTQLSDIANELRHYREQFRDKVVLCNCDDPYESNFFKYFALNFNAFSLRKLIATCYAGSLVQGLELDLFGEEAACADIPPRRTPYKVVITEVNDLNHDGATDLSDVELLLRSDRNVLTRLTGNGDFRSRECIELLEEADIVVTNPPFSLFREYVAQLVAHDKKFIIIGHQNAITYKEIFPLIKANKLWLGYGFKGGAAHFYSHYKDTASAGDHREGMIRVSGVTWFTNLDTRKRHEELDLYKHYTPEEYPRYDNYDAINVDRTADIPCDYYGVMGVPITFLDKYNPEQFEIVEFRRGDDGKDLIYSNYSGGGERSLISEYSFGDVDSRTDEQSRIYDRERVRQLFANTRSATAIPGLIKNAEGKINGKITYARITIRKLKK